MMVVGTSLVTLSACNNASGNRENILARQMEVKRVKDSLELDSFKRVEAAKTALKELEEEKAETSIKGATIVRRNNTSNVIHASDQQSIAQKKKGWSDAAKGGVIGGAAGAGIGALIDKKKPVRGAVIGAAVGGGSGYAIGRKSDRESGRVQK